jgi:hypothetical protein
MLCNKPRTAPDAQASRLPPLVAVIQEALIDSSNGSDGF